LKNNIVALIPARSGSKGVPNKNILPLAEFPLIAYSIKAALKSKLIDRVIVSTDSKNMQLLLENMVQRLHSYVQLNSLEIKQQTQNFLSMPLIGLKTMRVKYLNILHIYVQLHHYEIH